MAVPPVTSVLDAHVPQRRPVLVPWSSRLPPGRRGRAGAAARRCAGSAGPRAATASAACASVRARLSRQSSPYQPSRSAGSGSVAPTRAAVGTPGPPGAGRPPRPPSPPGLAPGWLGPGWLNRCGRCTLLTIGRTLPLRSPADISNSLTTCQRHAGADDARRGQVAAATRPGAVRPRPGDDRPPAQFGLGDQPQVGLGRRRIALSRDREAIAHRDTSQRNGTVTAAWPTGRAR